LVGNIPAGTYEEVIYFLPLAFRSILASEMLAGEIIPDVISFVSDHDIQFRKDNLSEPSRDCLREFLVTWSQDFNIVDHITQRPVEGFERIKHIYYVKFSDLIVMMTGEFIRHHTYRDIAESFVRDLAAFETDAKKAAWFLEYAQRRKDPWFPKMDEAIAALIHDEDALMKAALVILDTFPPNTPLPPYWRQAFRALRLE
jgi:hypothetical protein